MINEYSPILIGQVDRLKIFFEYREYLKVLKFGKAGASDGSRGVLLGARDGENVYITKVIEAVYCGGEGLELPVFSPLSWGRILSDIKENYSGLSVIGQFSTHPDINPARMDYIMQEKYFPSQQNLLFIFDPADNLEKMYIYRDREFEFLNGFYIYDRYENPINLNEREAVVRPLSREYEIRMRIFDDIKKKIKKQNLFYSVFAIFVILFLIYNTIHSFEIEKRYISDREKTIWNNE